MDLTKQAIDIERADEGVWINLDGETEFKIRRIHSRPCRAILQRVGKTMDSAFKDLTKTDPGLIDLLVEGIVVDWRNLKDDGKDVPYSREKCREIMEDERLIELRQYIIGEASNMEHFRQQKLEDAVKKSGQ